MRNSAERKKYIIDQLFYCKLIGFIATKKYMIVQYYDKQNSINISVLRLLNDKGKKCIKNTVTDP